MHGARGTSVQHSEVGASPSASIHCHDCPGQTTTSFPKQNSKGYGRSRKKHGAGLSFDELDPTKCQVWNALGPRRTHSNPTGADEIVSLGRKLYRSKDAGAVQHRLVIAQKEFLRHQCGHDQTQGTTPKLHLARYTTLYNHICFGESQPQ